jgi:hypothetical protein
MLMKNLSLAFFAVGTISTLVAATMWEKTHTDGKAIIEAANLTEEVIKYRETVKTDTVWAVVYRTLYVKIPEATIDSFSDSTATRQNKDYLGAVDGSEKYKDTVEAIDIADYVKVPKNFVYSDSNVYLAGTVTVDGVGVDSISVPAKIHYNPVWSKYALTVGVMSYNPYLTGLSPVMCKKPKACFLRW